MVSTFLGNKYDSTDTKVTDAISTATTILSGYDGETVDTTKDNVSSAVALLAARIVVRGERVLRKETDIPSILDLVDDKVKELLARKDVRDIPSIFIHNYTPGG